MNPGVATTRVQRKVLLVQLIILSVESNKKNTPIYRGQGKRTPLYIGVRGVNLFHWQIVVARNQLRVSLGLS